MPRSASAAKTKRRGTGSKSKSLDVASLRVALAKAAGVDKVSRATLAKLIGAHENTIALWDSGKPIGPGYLVKLVELEAQIARGEKIQLAAKRKGGRPKRAHGATPAARKPGRPKKAATAAGKSGSFDVKALRAKLGASRNALAKLLGVSAGSILNWETPGKTAITAKNLVRLRELAKRVDSGEVSLPTGSRGRPKAAAATAPRRGRPPKLTISGDARILYANVASVQVVGGEALVRFALALPGKSGARAVADVVLPLEALGGI